MTAHERGLWPMCPAIGSIIGPKRISVVCSACDGTGMVKSGIRGANDPDVHEIECDEPGCYSGVVDKPGTYSTTWHTRDGSEVRVIFSADLNDVQVEEVLDGAGRKVALGEDEAEDLQLDLEAIAETGGLEP